MTISSKELIYEALDFKPVPRVPHAIGFTISAREKLLSCEDGRKLYDSYESDFGWSPILLDGFGLVNEDGYYTDEYGITWDKREDPDIGIPFPIITPESLDSYELPDPSNPDRFIALENNLKSCPDKFQVIAFNSPLYERAWMLRGMELFLMDMISNQSFAEALLDKLLEFNISVMEITLEKYPDIDGVYFGDDFGSQNGLIMGGALWRKLIKPRLAKQYGVAKSAGKKVFIHSCGKVQELFDDFVEIGVDCFNPFQPEVMDTHMLLDEYYGRLAFHGGISTQKLLPYGNVNDVEEEVELLLEKGKRGGYVIAPAHSIPGDAKIENICAMIRKIIYQ